jgi:tripartite-type tricarboxylate transporter receptor subunit TctC
MHRRTLGAATAALALGALPRPAAAQQWPTRPVRVVLPVPPGGGTDILARIVQPHLQERLGQPVLVENRAGGGMTIGTNIVAKAEPDGHTPQMDTETIWGFWVPAATPAAIGERFARELTAVLAMPSVKQRVEELGFVPRGGTPAAYGARFEAELAKWGPIVRAAGVQAG